MTIRTKVKEIEINGWAPIDPKLFAYLKPQFSVFFAEERKKYQFGKREEAGSRFLNNETVWRRIITGLWNAHWEPFDLSEDEKRYLIGRALKDCASADYFYHWEKDYD